MYLVFSSIVVLLEVDQNWFYLVTDFPAWWLAAAGPAEIKAQARAVVRLR